MRPKVYLETTVINYLTAWPGRDLIIGAHREIAREWWKGRSRFDLYISQIVLKEAEYGEAEELERRVELLKTMSVLETTEEAAGLAQKLVEHGPIPAESVIDALHIAIPVVNGIDYLLTRNFIHIANAAMRRRIEQVCRSDGYEPVIICTPEELMEGEI